jgi:hypothetical protein
MSETVTLAAEPTLVAAPSVVDLDQGPVRVYRDPLEAIVAADVAADLAAQPAPVVPAPVTPNPNIALRAKLQEARAKAATAKRQLMLDNLADAVCDMADAIIAASV